MRPNSCNAHQHSVGGYLKRKRATAEGINGSPKRASEGSAPSVAAVLQELFDLLEDYAPMWYTEEMHNRAVSALSGRYARRLKRSA